MNVRIILAITALLVIVGISSWFLYREDIRQALAPQDRDRPDYRLDDFSYTTHDKKGRQKYTLKGKHMEHYPDGERFLIDEVIILAYDDAQLLWKTEAKQAVVYEPERRILLKGETVVHYYSQDDKEPIVLVSSDVTIHTDDSTADSSQPTRVTYTQGVVTSKDGFRIDGETRHLVMQGDVRGEIAHD
ncbi:MAG: LPS export ABC transporter periplasmic protein LptC [Gammaproteobacteria bacterium]|nr:LPS export ABC transporter periplasmic protein LptC [Gammaproteobacteria bacterium]